MALLSFHDYARAIKACRIPLGKLAPQYMFIYNSEDSNKINGQEFDI
jgi:hypothetical protein